MATESVRQFMREFAETQSYVVSPMPELPELTGKPFIDVLNQFALSEDVLTHAVANANMPQAEYLEVLLEIAGNLGGGLTPDGKQLWIEGRITEGKTVQDCLVESARYLESIAS